MSDPGDGAPADPADAARRLERRAREWRVRVERITETPTSLVAYGTRDGEATVLKVVRSPGEEWEGGRVAAAFRGRGVVRVLDHGPGAVLLERLAPGTPLTQVVARGRDDEALEILAGVIREMAGVSPSVEGFPTAEAWGEAFDRHLAGGTARITGAERIPRALVDHARGRYRELCASQGPNRLLHGDLHHDNVLHDRSRGWAAIDPKGVVAELEYELGAALRNPLGFPALQSSASSVHRRVERLAAELPVDGERVLAWAYVQAVLAMVWMVEDDVAISPDNPSLLLARTLAPPRIFRGP